MAVSIIPKPAYAATYLLHVNNNSGASPSSHFYGVGQYYQDFKPTSRAGRVILAQDNQTNR